MVLVVEKYRIEIKPTAEYDLIRRHRQTAGDSPHNALNWYLQITEAIEKLDISAERYPAAPEDADNEFCWSDPGCEADVMDVIKNRSPVDHALQFRTLGYIFLVLSDNQAQTLQDRIQP